jgi:Protein of unknown function (DUF3108)
MKFSTIVAILAAFLVIAPGWYSAHASTVQETLNYELTWVGEKIGTSRIETTLDGQDLDIVSTVRSAPWTAPFYKVDDRETSKLRRTGGSYALQSYRMHLREGTNDWQRIVGASRKDNKFSFYNAKTMAKTFRSYEDLSWDPVSCLYVLRKQQLAVGRPIAIKVLDRDKVNRVVVKVLRRETVTTPAGTFRTIVISPDMSIESEGLFYARGPLTIWLTDDAKKVPVVIEKRIENLFRDGVPQYLQKLTPASVRNNVPKMETIRAVLTGGSW